MVAVEAYNVNNQEKVKELLKLTYKPTGLIIQDIDDKQCAVQPIPKNPPNTKQVSDTLLQKMLENNYIELKQNDPK